MIQNGEFDAKQVLESIYSGEGSSENSLFNPVKYAARSKFDASSSLNVRVIGSTDGHKEALIDVASRVKYSEMTTERMAAGVLSMVLYSGGVVLICIVVGRQFENVLSAAGWLAG